MAQSLLARRVRDYFPQVAAELVEDYRQWKAPGPISAAKRFLAVARQRGEVLKPFPKIKHAINLGDYVFNPVSNCHLECTYCILQSYLKNNPIITLFADWDHYRQAIHEAVRAEPAKTFRLGTGELSDSLALDAMTGLSEEWVPFFSGLSNAYLELKTKSDCIDRLPHLDHGGHTVVSWSLAPESVVAREELKCASLQERLQAAQRVQDAGYPVGLHLDPLIHFDGWEDAYEGLVSQVARTLSPERIAWVSVGSLRYDKTLKEVATGRFPQTKIFSEDFVASPDGKMRYFKTLRIEMYRKVWGWLKDWSEDFPRYLCMEPAWVWEKVRGEAAPSPESMEDRLVRRLGELRP